ncbi:2993_t:CDS:1, partial [Scutellospora calospora]
MSQFPGGHTPPEGSYPPQAYPPQGQYGQQGYYQATEGDSQPLTGSGVTFAESDRTSKHYGRAPLRQPRRYKTTKRVELYQGNLVLDCPVPTKFLQM